MAAVEHFDADEVELDTTVSCTFTLNGRDWSCRNRDEVDARIAGALLGNGAVNVAELFSGLLVDDDVDDFVALLNGGDFPLPIKRTQALMEFLSEQVMNRPTVRPKSSGTGPQPTKRTSGAVSSSQGTRRARSAS
jgi:hypothetical protein